MSPSRAQPDLMSKQASSLEVPPVDRAGPSIHIRVVLVVVAQSPQVFVLKFFRDHSP